jgi:hypothetical protein
MAPRKPRSTAPQSALRVSAVVLVLTVLVLIFAGPYYQRLAEAERVTVRITSCDNEAPRGNLVCRGAWQLADGSARTGPIEGGATGEVGEEFAGWATATHATKRLLAWLLIPVLVTTPVALGLGAAFFVIIRGTLRARRAAR